jgi:tetratricopeptide (TPR) repeat protein
VKRSHLSFALVLTLSAGAACAFDQPMGPKGLDGAVGKSVSAFQVRDKAIEAFKSIQDVLNAARLFACNRCKSGYALKVVEQALQKQPMLAADEYAEVERLRAEGQALYDEGKYVESLELLRQAQSILGIDASGSPVQASPTNTTSNAAAQPAPGR